MEIGAWVGNNGPATAKHMLSVAQTADRAGLASVWAADHVLWPVEYESKYPYGGDKYPADFNQPVCEWVTTMTWLSARTERVPGDATTRVVVGSQRPPEVVSGGANGSEGADALARGVPVQSAVANALNATDAAAVIRCRVVRNFAESVASVPGATGRHWPTLAVTVVVYQVDFA